MDKFDASKLLSLLERYVSEETKKSRRNTIFISFIITSIYFLDLKMTNLKMFGLSLSEGNESNLLILAVILQLFWFTIFIINYVRDIKIDAERKYLLNEEIRINDERLIALNKEKEVQAATGLKFSNREYRDRNIVEDALNSYRTRTDSAMKLSVILWKTELWLPIGLFLGSSTILLKGLIPSGTL